MEKSEFLPIYHRPGVYEDGVWTFQATDKEIVIANVGKEILNVLRLANGHISSDEIERQLSEKGQDSGVTESIVEDLSKLQILIDSREQLLAHHGLTLNPSPYNRQLTAREITLLSASVKFEPKKGETLESEIIDTSIGALAKGRESCRNFKSDPIDPNIIATCLDAAYSSERRPIPSAGGLYPLRLYALVNRGSECFPEGYYQYDHDAQKLVNFNNSVDWERLKHVFNSEDLLHNAPVIFVICADLTLHPKKYSNRGYRYSLLEAGHAAQNIHLIAQELELGSLEYGGFDDEKLSQELQLSPDEKPLITLALGQKNYDPVSSDLFETLLTIEDYIGQDKPIAWVHVNALSKMAKSLDFHHATAKYRPPSPIYPKDSELFASGTANSIDLARIKAIAEAFERYTAGRYKYDVLASTEELTEEWLSTEIVKPLTDDQYQQQKHLEKFDLSKRIQWIRGLKCDGTTILVPVDLVFYPLNEAILGRKNIVESDSSGMAAHTNYEEAVMRGLLELIERDATMRLWFSKEPPTRIAQESLPEHLQRRNEYWKLLSKTVEVINLSHDGIAIVNVIIRSPDGVYPYLVSGASASFDSFEAALVKAYQETELGFTNARFSEKKQKWIEPKDVYSPEDHGRFYYYDNAKPEVEWLWSGVLSTDIPRIHKDPKTIDKYEYIVVRLTEDIEPLQVVRVLCPSLVPINFGFGNEYYSHPSAGHINNPFRVPHFFG